MMKMCSWQENQEVDFQSKDKANTIFLLFFPGGSVQVKENMCSCTRCMDGDLIDCLKEHGYIISDADCDFDNEDDSNVDIE